MKCDVGHLQAYLDDALLPAERQRTAAHLADCDRCQAELAALETRRARVRKAMALLNPAPEDVPDAAWALKRLRASSAVSADRPPLTTSAIWANILANMMRSFEMLKRSLLTGWRRPVTISATALACLLILFSFAPVRQAAADFLGIFRVRKFAVIPVDPSQMSQLENLAEQAKTGVFGEPTLVREPVDPQPMANVAEASAVAGFPVRMPTTLPEGALRTRLEVEFGPALHYEIDRATMERLLQAAQVTDVALPDVDRVAVDVDIPALVTAGFSAGERSFQVLQLPSPEVDVPTGVDPAVFGEIGLRVLGMPADEAHSLAQQIDWASTLVIPLPSDVASFRPVTVNGVEGLLLEESADDGRISRSRVVLWQKDGYVYMIEGHRIDFEELLQIADSLR